MDVPLGPAPLDISGVRAGDLNEFQLTVLAGGAPVDLTDMTVTATARYKQTDADGVDAEIELVDALHGVIRIRWPGEDVRTWLADKVKGSGVWDLQMANGSDPTTICAGKFSAEMDVTR